MFEGFANFLQGNGWVSNSQLDEDKKKRNQDAALAQARASVPFATYDPNSNKFTNSAEIAQANQNVKTLEMPDLSNQFSPEQLFRAQESPNAPWNTKPQRTFLQDLNDFTAQSNDALYGGLARGGANIFNSLATGFDGEETRERTEGFLRSIGQSDEGWQSRLAQGTDKDSTAGRLGQAVGGTQRLVAEVAPTVLIPAAGALKATQGLSTGKRLASVAGIDAGIGGAFSAGTSMSQGNSGEDILRDTAIGAGLGGAIGAGTALAQPYLQRFLSNAAQRSNPAQVAGGVRASLLRSADDIERTVAETPPSQLGKLDDGISSPTVAEAKRVNAQNTANFLRQQADQIPDEAPQPPQITTQNLSNPDAPLVLQKATPEQLIARSDAGDVQATTEIQRRLDQEQPALDAGTTAPAPAALTPDTEPLNTPMESPITQQSREVADNTAPVSPEAVDAAMNPVSDADARMAANRAAQDAGTPVVRQADELTSYEGAPDRARVDEYKQRIANGEQLEPVVIVRDSQGNLGIEDGKHRFQAYQEMGVEDIPTVERGAGSQTDPRISQLYQEAEGHLNRADEILAREGSDVGQLGEKLYVADVNGTTATLTPAEREAFRYLSDNITDAERVLTSQGIIDRDLGVRRNYLPTGDEAGVEQVFTPEDINASTFNYAKGRSGGFINSDGTVSDKLPKGIRSAYTDYYVRGKGSQYLSDAQVDEIKSTRISQTDMNDMMFGPSKEPLSGLDGKPVKLSGEKIVKNAEEFVDLEREYARVVNSGDEAAIQKAQKAVNQKSIDNSVAKISQMKDEVDKLIKDTNASDLPRNQKTARIVELENRLDYVRQQTAYQQSYVKTNLLFQVPGRVADQIAKVTQSVGDALTSPLTRGATSSFRPGTRSGRQAARTVAGDAALNQRGNNYMLNRGINDANANNVLQKASGRYTAAGTRLTELGSRQSAPTKDTARYFAAQAEDMGIDDADGITEYIRNAIGTQEWDRVFNQFSTNRNRFSGIGDITGSTVRGGPGVSKGWVNARLDDWRRGINEGLDKTLATMLPRSVRRNMADAISIPLVGFPRVVWNVGSKGMDYATVGMTSLYKASRIQVVDDATALQKALHVRDAIDGAAAGSGLIGLGVLLGQSDMITGSEPEKQANGEWVPPYSLKLGDNYIELGRFIGPYAVPIMLAAAISRGDGAADAASIPAVVTGQVLANFGADSLGDTISTMGEALNGDLSGLANRTPNMLSAFAPLSGEINSIANATDPYQRDATDDNGLVQFMKQLVRKVPGLRQQLDPKLDQFGNEIPGSPLKAVLPLSTVGSGWGESELGAEANRLELTPSGNSNTQENAEEMAGRLIQSEWYQGLDDEKKKEALQSTLYSGKLGDINENLSDASKDALALGTLMSPDERNKWLENATSARDYHVANYENAVENGTLTAKQDSLENSSSLHYKAVASQVNIALPYWTAELEELYKSTSKTELYAMAPDNPTRQKLLALDAARAEAGVSLKSGDHSTNKYGDGTGSGRGGKNFSFASSTAANAEKSGFSQQTLKPGFNAQLVKPLGIGEASEKVKRKISVKRGVQL